MSNSVIPIAATIQRLSMQQAKTLPDLLRRSAYQWTGRPAMLIRKGKDFEPLSYSAFYETARKYAGALRGLGLKKGDRVAILSENCPDWAFADWGAQSLGITVVPIYPTLPADQVEYIVADSEAKVVIAGDNTQFEKTKSLAGAKSFLLKGEGETLEKMALASQNEIRQADWEKGFEDVDPEDIATIIYTSGTTGPPKGAMLPHRAYTFLCASAVHTLPVDENDIFLCFLPMSHVYERFGGQVLPISCGACIAFAKSLASLASDILAVRPTIMLCVPRFLEATSDKIVDGSKKEPAGKQKIFNLALEQGVRHAQGKFAPLYPVTNALVGKKIREKLGGRIRFFVSGGAALPPHVAEFYMAFGLKVLQGYGLTETTAASCLNHPDRSKYWTVGEPMHGVEIRFASDGEILIRGQSVMAGYWNKPNETAEAIDSEGWFHTGDIGEWEGSYVKITDRKKDLLVLANGKNIAPQPIESKMKSSPLISEAVVLGDGLEHCIALVTPNFDHLREVLKEKGIDEKDDGKLAALPETRAALKAEIDKVNKSLANFEMVKKFAVLSEAFTIESGELTPSLKVKRKVVKERYKDLIATLS
jgi:long-chain acyl-CoA synthetase